MSDRDFSNLRNLGAGLEGGRRCPHCTAVLGSEDQLKAHLREQHPGVREGDRPVPRPRGEEHGPQGG